MGNEVTTFTGFRQADVPLNKVLLLDILLNGGSIEEIEKVEEITSHAPFANIDRKCIRVFGLTKEAIDVKKIYQERESILIPTICSIQNYEACTVSDIAYCHKAAPSDEPQPLKIHDMGIISPHMVITPDTVISSRKAKPFNELENADYGFDSFMKYVLYGQFEIKNWKVTYDEKNKEFKIVFTSKSCSELVYLSKEYSKDATFALVLYLIKKVYSNLNEDTKPDNFIVERWVREKGRKN